MIRISQQGCMTLGQLAELSQRPVYEHVLGQERLRREQARRDFALYARMDEQALSSGAGSKSQQARDFVAKYRAQHGRKPTAPQVMTGADVKIKVAQRALREAA